MAENRGRAVIAAVVAGSLALLPALVLGFLVRHFYGTGPMTWKRLAFAIGSGVLSIPWVKFVVTRAGQWVWSEHIFLEIQVHGWDKDVELPKGMRFSTPDGRVYEATQPCKITAGTKEVRILAKKIPAQKETPAS